MSVFDFPMPLLPVTGRREHRLLDTDDIDTPLPLEERNRERARQYYERNRARILAEQRSPEAVARRRERQAEWRAANRELLRVKERAWYAANRDRIAAARKERQDAAKKVSR